MGFNATLLDAPNNEEEEVPARLQSRQAVANNLAPPWK